VWSDSDQHDFDKHIARATASANLPLRWVEDPEVIALFQRFIPAAHIPSRKVLTKRLIPTEVNNLRTASHNKTVGALATGQADGWSGGNFHHYLAFMMIADGKVKTVMLHDASSERKDANKLLEHMLQALETMERDHKVTVIGFTTDSSGESLKARKLLKQLRPDLIVLPCYAHQVRFQRLHLHAAGV
ncbi:hypothetical protein K474DRAFT_1603428, partial [Panus rudis PR-1116 ss-1]